MARKFLVPIDLNKNELQNAAIQNLATAPSSPVAGQIYYNTTSKAVFVFDGTNWDQIGGMTYGTLSARPTATSVSAGTFYYATDNYLIYYSDASTWQQSHAFNAVTAQTSYGLSSADGTATTYSRSDHVHGTVALGTTTPNSISIAGSGSAGSGTAPSKQDHSHAGPGFGSVIAETSFGQSSANGTATTVAHSDHTHGSPSLSITTPTAITSSSGSVGTGTTAAVADHSHGFTAGSFALSAFAVPVANISLNSYKITNLTDPTSAQDGATKNYVDAVAQGLSVKGSVVAATTANITLLGAQTIDGVSVVATNRVLVKNQTIAANNGIYVASASTWARSSDQLTPAQGDFTFVEQGTTNGSQGWILANGTTTWTQFSAAGEYTSGNGITITGNSIAFNPLTNGGLQTASGGASILLPTNSGLSTGSTGLAVGAGTGITVSTSTVSIDTSVVVRKYAANVGDGSSTSITVTHSLNTKDVTVAVYDNASPFAEIVCDIQHSTTSAVTLLFSTAPTSNQYRVVVQG